MSIIYVPPFPMVASNGTLFIYSFHPSLGYPLLLDPINFCFTGRYYSTVMVLPVLVSSSDLYSISYLIPWKWVAINCQPVTSPHLTRVLCQIVKMFGVVTSVFALCWLPYHAYFIIIHYHPGIMRAW